MRTALAVAGACCLALGACSPPMREYQYPVYGFAISFPSPPKETDQPSDGKSGPRIILESTAAGGRDFVIETYDLRSYFAYASKDVMASAVQENADKLGGVVSSETPISTSSYSGRQYQLSKNGKPTTVLREFLAGSKFFIVAAASDIGPNDPAIDAYFNSFRLLPATPPPVNGA